MPDSAKQLRKHAIRQYLGSGTGCTRSDLFPSFDRVLELVGMTITDTFAQSESNLRPFLDPKVLDCSTFYTKVRI